MNISGVAATQSQTDESSANEGTKMKDDFLKLMVAQMENQNPLEPLDNAQFTAQLAQFSSLEQLVNVNTNLEDVQSLQSSMNNVEALGYLGRDVQAEGTQVAYAGEPAEIAFSLEGAADEVYLGIYSASGDLIRNEELGAMNSGEHLYTWDGNDNNGLPASDGRYTFSIGASAGDEDVDWKGYITGKVDGVSYDGGSPVLSIGGIKVDQDKIMAIK